MTFTVKIALQYVHLVGVLYSAVGVVWWRSIDLYCWLMCNYVSHIIQITFM